MFSATTRLHLPFGVQLVDYTLSLINDDDRFDFVIVVGDLDYYQRFGFNRIEQDIRFYGPVDKNKLLLKKCLKTGLCPPKYKGVDVMGAFVSINCFQVTHMAHDLIIL